MHIDWIGTNRMITSGVKLGEKLMKGRKDEDERDGSCLQLLRSRAVYILFKSLLSRGVVSGPRAQRAKRGRISCIFGGYSILLTRYIQ